MGIMLSALDLNSFYHIYISQVQQSGPTGFEKCNGAITSFQFNASEHIFFTDV
jgi:hypothetical protein